MNWMYWTQTVHALWYSWFKFVFYHVYHIGFLASLRYLPWSMWMVTNPNCNLHFMDELRAWHVVIQLFLAIRQCDGLEAAHSSRFVDGLTHKGRDKMAAISQTTLSSAFSWKKMSEFRLKFHWSLFNWQYSSIVSDNGLAPTRRQSIICSNDGKFTGAYMRRSASMS